MGVEQTGPVNSMPKILMIATSSDKLRLKDGTERPTGVWAEELIEPKDIFEKAGFKVDVATLGGKKPPFDEVSLSPGMLGGEEKAKEYKKEITEDYETNNPLNLNNLKEENIAKYDAIFIAGGHGVLEDLPKSEQMGKILKWSLKNTEQLTCAVCHGPAAFKSLGLVGEKMTKSPYGISGPLAIAMSEAFGTRGILEGIKMTGFSDEEEKAVGLYGKVPFDLEPTMKEWGAQYQQTQDMWTPFVTEGKMTDNGIPTVITGQNPASSIPLAKRIVSILLEKQKSKLFKTD